MRQPVMTRQSFTVAATANDSHNKTKDNTTNRGVGDEHFWTQWRLAQQTGDAGAQNALGLCYYLGNHGLEAPDVTKAAAYFQKAAQQGHADAQCNWAICHEQGHGVPQDVGQAVRYYQLAAQQGNARAQCNLGLCYAEGKGGLAVDLRQAMIYYQKAAAQGNVNAQYNLGLRYLKGCHTTNDDGNGDCEMFQQDWNKSLEWFRQAGARGHAKAEALGEQLGNLMSTPALVLERPAATGPLHNHEHDNQDETPHSSSCPVCFEAFGPHCQPVLTQCQHLFCVPCLTQILEQRPACAMCRRDLDVNLDALRRVEFSSHSCR